MSLTVSKIIIHELIKRQNYNEGDIYLSESLLTINDNVGLLIEKLNKSFTRDNLDYAIFEEGDGITFKDSFIEYSDDELSEDKFVSFSKLSITALRNNIRHVTGASGGFLVYSEYENRGRIFLGVYLIRTTEGIQFNKDEGNHNFDIDKIDHINTDKLAMACRIDINKFNTEGEKYLQLTKHKQENISGYFIDWIAAEQIESSKEYTENLISLVDSLDLPIDPDTSEKYEIDKFHKSMYDYIRGTNKVIRLKDISNHFYEDENYLSDHISDHDIDLPSEFTAHSGALKKLYKYDAKSGSIHLQFSKGDYSSGKVAPGAGNQIIISDQNFKEAFERTTNR